MLSQKDLKREIFSKKDSISERMLFLSDEYGSFLTQMGQGVTDCKSDMSSALFCEESDRIAYTDGKRVNINYKSPFTKGLNKLQKHMLYCGLNLHECGHVLFTDFKLEKKVLNEMAAGRIYPGSNKNDYLEDLQKFIEVPGNHKYIGKLFHALDNCIEDGFVDRAVMAEAPGYAKCLRYVLQIDKFVHKSYEEMRDMNMDAVSIFMNLTLSYARHGVLLFPEDYHDQICDMFREVMPYIEDAVYEVYPLLRKKAVWTVFCYLFHFIENQASNQASNDSQNQAEDSQSNGAQNQAGDSQGNGGQNQAGNSQSNDSQNQAGNSQSNGGQDQAEGSQNNGGQDQAEDSQSNSGQDQTKDSQSNGSQDQAEDNQSGDGQNCIGKNILNDVSISDMLKKLLENAGDQIQNTEKNEHINVGMPNETALAELAKKLKREMKMPAPESGSDIPFESLTDELNKIAEKIAISKISNDQEKDIKKQMSCDIKEFLDGVDILKKVDCIPKRTKISLAAKEKYDLCHTELDVIVKRLISTYQKEIKERQIGDTLTGLYMGKRLNAREAYRYDKRTMSRKIAPEDIPDMEICLLIDISGSMSGQKIETAIECAYITYQFCRKLEIPCSIIGHSTCGSKVLLENICDERSIDKKDSQRIFSVTTHDRNRDGYAVWFCIKKLEKTVADQKLLMVISDGMPNHDGYGISTGRSECQAAVKYGIKHGITTIAAAIGDPSGVRSVYKDGVSEKNSAEFLDITDLRKLPKTFVKIIKRRLA